MASSAEQQLGRRLQRFRAERDWSQERLADAMTAAGIPWNQQTVTRTETARRPIRINEAATLARVLGVPLAALVDPGVSASTAEQAAAVDRAMLELEEVQRRIDAQLGRLRIERTEIEVEQGQARWRAQEDDLGPPPFAS
jgi:transcriptional regulator with XRE-family HTH domain